MFYFAIRVTYDLRQEDFPKNPKLLLNYLENVLGEWGFPVIKHAITNELGKTFKIHEENLDSAIQSAEEIYLLESDMEPSIELKSRGHSIE